MLSINSLLSKAYGQVQDRFTGKISKYWLLSGKRLSESSNLTQDLQYVVSSQAEDIKYKGSS